MIRHAGLIARFERGAWRGVLIEGPSGVGKSDLALRALDLGWSLVADDRTVIWASQGRLYGRAPDSLEGRIEVRGHGVLTVPRRRFAPIALVARCLQAVERMPEPDALSLLDLTLPLVAIVATEASAPAKLGRALSLLDFADNRRIKRPALAEFSPGAGGVP